jgi:rare lipoprotein A
MRWLLLLSSIFSIFHEASSQIGFTQKGKASYYSIPFHGRKTANGEVFDMEAFTAAHQTLAFNSLVKVTNLKTKKSIVVRINDRGPFRKKRIIDLSHSAAKALNFLHQGTILVKIEVIGSHNKSKQRKLEFELFTTDKFYSSKGIEFTPNGFGIQIASFSDKNNALKACKQLESKGYKTLIKVKEINKTRMYRIFAGTYPNEKAASKVRKRLLKDYPSCFVYLFSH